MTLHGHIQNGEIVLAPHGPLPEGAEVQIQVLAPTSEAAGHTSGASFVERYKDVIGSVDGLPADLSVNLDHYLYGTPKRQ